ncbi:carbohydrate kinase family protein [Actinacidiphila glaucinigra]|uniref:Fructokinase n=2 Tax=Actinacidiphila glaucinigra TaxID=235986 RepID=A0A239CNS6_9ACTN|nr:carbohydrate kinase [Actinacidiphila glaucinigra]SNS21388.1 fructokinase [Actinacidiphila glaucinigra]
MTTPATLVAGEALTDVVLAPDGTRRAHPGGSPANTALGLARLGHPVTLATRIGRDAHGDALAERLAEGRVRLLPGSVVHAPTSTARAELDGNGSAVYRFDITWDLPPVDPHEVPGHLHTGSIATALEPGAGRILSLVAAVRRRGHTVSYDPNLRPALLGPPGDERPRVERLVALADVVKASEEDLGWLHPGRDPGDVAADWARRGPRLVVLTRGAAGAEAHWAPGGRHRVPAHPVRVVDTIGAGDAFMAGLLSGLLSAGLLGGAAARRRLHGTADGGSPPPAVAGALELAARVAALTCGRAGADPPFLAEVAPVM